jgi:endoglucanase
MLLLAILFAHPASSAASDMPSDAKTLASKLGLGWNLGNALESCSDSNSASETSWGNPATTKALITAVKAAGFKTVRIPCAWSGYIDDQKTYHIKESWLKRVAEVVGYVTDNGMYAIINTHWDGGWLEEHCTKADQSAVNAKEKAIWTQIATYFKNYDEHLIFAGVNEVREGYGNPSDDNIAVQQSYLQTFVDAVRATGGNNQYRNLIVQAYRTDIQAAVDHLKIPKDSTSNRILVEVHFYDPWDFCGEGGDVYLWGKDYAGGSHVSSWGQEDWIDEAFTRMKNSFISKGYPVIIGEFSVIYRSSLSSSELTKHKAARNYYLSYLVKSAVGKGLVPIYWDNGDTGDKGCGLFDRKSNKAAFQDTVTAMVNAAK